MDEQQILTAKDAETGRTVRFQWHEATPPTEEDLAEVFAANEGGPPEPSVMDERGMVDKAVDWLPSIGGALGGFASRAKGTPVGAVAAGAGAATGEMGRQLIRLAQGRGEQVPDTFGGSLERAGKVGVLNAAQEGGGRLLMGVLMRLAPKMMHQALGAQAEVRKGFPEVDLDAVAVREGARVPKDAGKIAERAGQNAASLRSNLRNADIASGNAPIAGHADAVRVLRERVPDARMAAKGGRPEELNAVKEGLRDVRGLRTRPLNREETFVTKQANQKGATSAMRAKAGAEGDFGAEVKQDIARGLNNTLKTSTPEYASDVQRQQELIALERALFNAAPRTSVLRDSLGATTAAGAGMATGAATGDPIMGLLAAGGTMAAQRAATSPGALSRYAIGADRLGQFMNGPAARVPDAVTRQLFLELLMGKPEAP